MSTLEKSNSKSIKYVSIVGIERAGKGTLIHALRSNPDLKDIIFVNEPGSSPRARIFRAILKPREESSAESISGPDLRRISELKVSPEVYFHTMTAARHELLDMLTETAGATIISDRGHLCTLAYQCYGQGLTHHINVWQDTYRKLFIDNNIDDLHVLLDISPEESLRRKDSRQSTDAFDEKDLKFYEDVRRGYLRGLEFINTQSRSVKPRGIIVSGAQPKEQSLTEMTTIIKNHFGL